MSIPLQLNEEDPISTAVSAIVNADELAGAATLVWRAGKVIHAAGIGWRDVEAKLPIERDTLFRIASMTKPITSAAALMLFEEGRFALNDPIARWAPEFSQMPVLRSHNGPLDQTDPAERPITFEDLLTHRSGLTYGALSVSLWEPGLGSTRAPAGVTRSYKRAPAYRESAFLYGHRRDRPPQKLHLGHLCQTGALKRICNFPDQAWLPNGNHLVVLASRARPQRSAGLS
jgi:CubicO group peptidase (beta-lactamase class C family)